MKTKKLIFSVNLSLNVAELFEELARLSIEDLKGARVQITNDDSDESEVTPIVITSASTMMVLPEDLSTCFVLEIVGPEEVVHLEHYNRGDIVYDDALALANWIEGVNAIPVMPFRDVIIISNEVSGFICRTSQIEDLTGAMNLDVMYDFVYNRAHVFSAMQLLNQIDMHELDFKNGNIKENFFESTDVGRYVKWLVGNFQLSSRFFFEVI